MSRSPSPTGRMSPTASLGLMLFARFIWGGGGGWSGFFCFGGSRFFSSGARSFFSRTNSTFGLGFASLSLYWALISA